MSGPVTPAAGVIAVRNSDGLECCTGCGAPVVSVRGGQVRVIHHWHPCPEAEKAMAGHGQ